MTTRSMWVQGMAWAVIALAGACARGPDLGAQVPVPTVDGTGIRVQITGASVDADSRVVVSYMLFKDGVAMTGDAARRMLPAFTLAGLGLHPVDGLPAWRSYVLDGKGRIPALPISGPGTPDAYVLKDTRQPGADVDGAVTELGQGRFAYRFTVALPPAPGPDETLRVGVWLRGAAGTRQTTSTLDFTRSGASPTSRELVIEQACDNCHGTRQGHSGSRTGTRICVTCHTYQHADPDTLDPAAMAGATLATNPNPLEFGRLVHRIHRGRQLPTLFKSSSANVAPALPPPAGVTLPQPYLSGRNAPLLGQKFSVIDDDLGERIFGQVYQRTANGRPAATFTSGAWFPQDYRNCDVCHGGAAQRDEMITDTSRRTCQGCHPDVWYGQGTTDPVHFAHTGGPQPDDTRCATCHLRSEANPNPMVPHEDAHVVPYKSRYYNMPVVQVLDVQNFSSGQKPTLVLAVTDGDGPLSPVLNAPSPTTDPRSPVRRALSSVSLQLSGPTTDYASGQGGVAGPASVSASVPGASAVDPAGRITYTFTNALPQGMTGTWAIGLQASRSVATTNYDASTGTFRWPYTGESLREAADNVVVYVDTATGTLGGGAPVPRRRVVDVALCEKCHIRLAQHGGGRNKVELCVLCHTPSATDWSRRPKASSKNVDLGATYDGIEERSIQFKVMMHRMHTGNHKGRAELERNVPLVWGPQSRFYDDVPFPNKIKNCRICHAGNSFYVENVPADAAPTLANETPTLVHLATSTHVAGELSVPRLQSACNACHDTYLSAQHCAQYTIGGVESCEPCHAEGTSMSVSSVHGLDPQ